MNYEKENLENRNFEINLIKKVIKKFLYILLIVCIYNIFLITASALDSTSSREIFGHKAYIITTDSMKPHIREGDAIIVEKCSEDKLEVGHVITIRTTKESTMTHRIIGIRQNKETGQKEYITKGDNNNIEDPEIISYDRIEGKKVLVIPFLGQLLLSLENKMYIIILAAVIGLIVLRIISMKKKKKIRREKKRNEDNKTKEKQNIESSS